MIGPALLIIALVAPWVSRRLTGDVASPTAVVVVAWAGTIGLYFLHLLGYTAVTPRTWVLIAVSVALLCAGLWAGERLGRGRGDVASSRVSLTRAHRWLLPYAIAGLAGMAWYVWNVKTHFGWSAFLDAPRIRLALYEYSIPSTFLFLQYFCIAAPFVGLALAIRGERLRGVEWIAIALCGAGTWLSTDRTQFFTLVLVTVFMFAYAHGRSMSARRLAIGGIAIVALLVVNFAIVAKWVGKRPDLYLYATGSYPALSQAFDQPPLYTGGAHAFFPIVRLLEKLHLMQSSVHTPILDHVVISLPGTEMAQTFNAYTFLIYPYLDWGTTGMLIYALVIGVGCGLVYGGMRRRPDDPGRLLFAAILAGALTLSPFVNKFNNTGWWYIALLGVLPFVLSRTAKRSKMTV